MEDKKIHLEKTQKIAKAFTVLKAGSLQHELRSISGSSGLVLATPPLALQRLWGCALRQKAGPAGRQRTTAEKFGVSYLAGEPQATQLNSWFKPTRQEMLTQMTKGNLILAWFIERVQLPCNQARDTDAVVYCSNGLSMCKVVHHTLL